MPISNKEIFQEIKDISRRLESLREEMNMRFDRIEQRFDTVDERFDQADLRALELEKKIDKANENFETFKSTTTHQIHSVYDNFTTKADIEKFAKENDLKFVLSP
ncbi:hypothetical protein ACFL13_02310 [Patescibacteria group bacterium]